MYPKQIQNSGIFRTKEILITLSIYPEKIWHIRIPNTFQILVYWEPETCSEYCESLENSLHRTHSSLYPYHFSTRVIFRTQSNIYIWAFCSEPCVTLPYSKPEEYSQSSQAYMIQHSFKNLVKYWAWNIYEEVFYSELFVTKHV